jgi:hypothetical protein
MTEEPMAWRPKLSIVGGFSEEIRKFLQWQPGYDKRAGEHWSEVVELSLLERVRMFASVRLQTDQEVRRFTREFDVYQITCADDIFKYVLHLPKPLAEILDDENIPRTRTVWKSRLLYGPPPEWVGPLWPSHALIPVTPMKIASPEAFQAVQPLMKHVPDLPVFPDYMKVLQDLVELHPLKLPDE